jgi:HemY protein
VRNVAILLALALVVGGIVASLMARDSGYVLIVYDGMTLETSVWFALLVLMLVLLVLRLCFGLIRQLLRAGSGVRGWNAARRVRNAREQTQRGLVLLAEGDWSAARAALLNAVAKAEIPFVNYLGAARAANALGESESRDRLLEHAQATAAGSATGVGLTAAELMMDNGEFKAAEATLAALHRAAPRQPLVMKRLIDCRRRLGDYAGIAELDKELRRHKVLPEAEIVDLMRETQRQLLLAAGAEDVAGVWEAVPKALKDDEQLVGAAALRLAATGAPDMAEAVLRTALKNRYSDTLIAQYGRLVGADPALQLKTAESFIKAHQDNGALFLALGRIALRNAETAKAREYLETSLRLAPGADVYGELGQLCLSTGERERAAEYFAQNVAATQSLGLTGAARN